MSIEQTNIIEQAINVKAMELNLQNGLNEIKTLKDNLNNEIETKVKGFIKVEEVNELKNTLETLKSNQEKLDKRLNDKAPNIEIKQKGFGEESYKELLNNLKEGKRVNVTNVVNNNIETKQKGFLTTYNVGVNNNDTNKNTIIDLSTEYVEDLVINSCRVISTNATAKQIIPFVNYDSITATFNAENIQPSDTQKQAYTSTDITLSEIQASLPAISHELKMQIDNGTMEYDWFADVQFGMKKAIRKRVALTIMQGSGNNEPFGIITDYRNNNSNNEKNYGVVEVSSNGLEKIEFITEIIYQSFEKTRKRNGMKLFILPSVLLKLEKALKAIEDTPDRSDTKVIYNINQSAQALSIYIKNYLGIGIEIYPLFEEYGLSSANAGDILAIAGNFQSYYLASSNQQDTLMEKVQGMNRWSLYSWGFFGGKPILGRDFVICKRV